MPGQAFYGHFLREIFAWNHIPAQAKRPDAPCFTQQTGGLTRGIHIAKHAARSGDARSIIAVDLLGNRGATSYGES
jgi:hypothetical protein